MANMILSTVYSYFLILLIEIGITDAANLTYIPNFTNVMSCDGFSNDAVNLDDLSISTDDPSDEASGVGLSGVLKILAEIEEAHDVTLSVNKETETGNEPMFSSRLNVCQSLKDEDAPWYDLVQKMGISSCPIAVESYSIDDFKLSLEPYSDVLTRDFCGEYAVELCVMKEMDKLSCHTLGIEIIEVDLD